MNQVADLIGVSSRNDHLVALPPECFHDGKKEGDMRRIVQIDPDFLTDSQVFWLCSGIFCQPESLISSFRKPKISRPICQELSGFIFLIAWPQRAMTLVTQGYKSSEA